MRIVCGVLRLVDVYMIVVCGAIAFGAWFSSTGGVERSNYVLTVLFGALLGANFFHLNGAYRESTVSRLGESTRRATLSWMCVAAVLIAVSFVTKSSAEFSRGWSILWFAFTLAALIVSRVVVDRQLRQWRARGRLYRNAVVFGVGPIGQQFISQVAANAGSGIRLLAAFDDRKARAPDFCCGVPVAGDIDALIDFVRKNPVDMVVVALPWSTDDRLLNIVSRLQVVPVDVRMFPGSVGLSLKRPGVTHVGQITLLNVVDRPLSDWRLVFKEMEDRVLAAAILLFAAPLMAAIAAAIKLDSPGPVFFRQKRTGFNNQQIEVFKFRTMYADRCDATARELTRRDDPRVTRLGRFLRRTSLDELPQFLNVLRGEMSIVGPRPHASEAKAAGILYQEAVRDYSARHRVKPGITGLAQVNGWRGETTTLEHIQRRVELDLAYIDNWSLGLDLKIIFNTLLTGFTGKRAY